MRLSIRPEVEDKLVAFAEKVGESGDVLLETAIEEFLARQPATEYQEQLEKIAQETRAFIAMYPRLKEQYLNHYVAFHEGQLIDVDESKSALRKRIRAKYGQVPILLRKVESELDRVLMFRSPRMAKML